MVRRPPLPLGSTVMAAVPEAVRWLNAHGGFQMASMPR
jgi:hypothetical protein